MLLLGKVPFVAISVVSEQLVGEARTHSQCFSHRNAGFFMVTERGVRSQEQFCKPAAGLGAHCQWLQSLPRALHETMSLLNLILIVKSSKINLSLYSLNTAVKLISRFSIKCFLWQVWVPDALHLKVSASNFCWKYVHK